MKRVRSSQHLNRTTPERLRPLARRAGMMLVIALVAVMGNDARGGTVFMKNGYIIQGPIIDQDVDKIVLGWNNGKVFIHRRFTDSILLEAEEKEAIAQKKREAALTSADDIIPDGPVDEQGDDNLPDDLQQIIDQFAPTHPIPDPSFDDPLSNDSIISESSGGETDVESIVPDWVHLPELELSLEAPDGWKREDFEDGARWTGGAQLDGFLPSIVVVRASVDDLNADEVLTAFVEETGAGFEEFEIVEQRSVTFGGWSATAISGRGTAQRNGGDDAIPGESVEADAVVVDVRHTLVPGDGAFWLVSVFTTEETGEDVHTFLATTLTSMRFGATTAESPDDPAPASDTGDVFDPESVDSASADSDSGFGSDDADDSAPLEDAPLEDAPLEDDEPGDGEPSNDLPETIEDSPLEADDSADPVELRDGDAPIDGSESAEESTETSAESEVFDGSDVVGAGESVPESPSGSDGDVFDSETIDTGNSERESESAGEEALENGEEASEFESQPPFSDSVKDDAVDESETTEDVEDDVFADESSDS